MTSKHYHENNNDNANEKQHFNIDDGNSTYNTIMPLEMIWQPQEDITTYELAMCLPYFFRNYGVMPNEVDKSLPYFRHFKITDNNVY